MKRLMLLTLVALCSASCGDRGSRDGEVEPLRMVFTAIPDQDETLLRQRYEPVAAYLSDRLGFPVEYMHCTTYEDSVELFKNGDVHLAWFGGLTGVQARHAVRGARAIAQGEEDPKFYSYFIANKDTGLTRGDAFPEAIAGHSMLFGPRTSTSGRLMPEHFIRQNSGASPEDLFRSVDFSDGHDQTCALVAAGSFEVGVVNYTVYDRLVADGTIDPDACRVIWKTPTYADYNFTAHPALDAMFGAGTIDRVRVALVAMNDPALLASFDRAKLIPAENREFEPIRAVAAALGFIR